MKNDVLKELETVCRPVKQFLNQHGNLECKVEVSHDGAKMLGSMYELPLDDKDEFD